MVAKKSAKKAGSKKSATKAGKKVVTSAKKALTGKSSKKSGKKSTGPSLLNKAKKALKAVFAGAAEGAIVGAAEAGSKATGIGPTDQKTGVAKTAAPKKAARKK